MTTAPRPGWYPDPTGADDRFRWWDGSAWTGATSDSPRAPAPTAAEGEPSLATAPRRRSPAMVVLTLTVCAALVLTAGAGMVALVWRDSAAPEPSVAVRSAAAPQSAETDSAPSGPGGELEEKTRRAEIAGASMLLPEDPYRVHPDPLSVRELLDVAFVAEAKVHRRADGQRDWSAMVALSSLSDSRASGDLEAVATATVDELADRMYGTTSARLADLTVREHNVDGHEGVLVTAKAHYRIKDLPSRYDDVTAVLVRSQGQTMVAAISSVPNDADAELSRLAAESLASLTIDR